MSEAFKTEYKDIKDYTDERKGGDDVSSDAITAEAEELVPAVISDDVLEARLEHPIEIKDRPVLGDATEKLLTQSTAKAAAIRE